jgi:hypothetical protein
VLPKQNKKRKRKRKNKYLLKGEEYFFIEIISDHKEN